MTLYSLLYINMDRREKKKLPHFSLVIPRSFFLSTKTFHSFFFCPLLYVSFLIFFFFWRERRKISWICSKYDLICFYVCDTMFKFQYKQSHKMARKWHCKNGHRNWEKVSGVFFLLVRMNVLVYVCFPIRMETRKMMVSCCCINTFQEENNKKLSIEIVFKDKQIVTYGVYDQWPQAIKTFCITLFHSALHRKYWQVSNNNKKKTTNKQMYIQTENLKLKKKMNEATWKSEKYVHIYICIWWSENET